jgi:hypothetical protein
VKRLRDSETEASLGQLKKLVESAEPYRAGPFDQRNMQSRLARALQAGVGARRGLRPALLGVGALLTAATAAAAGYTLLAPRRSSLPEPPSLQVAPSAPTPHVELPAPVGPQAEVVPPVPPSAAAAASAAGAASAKQIPKRAGEDPSQVAEAVRALRKQGDAARAQQLLDQYLRNNPHGALSEDALALAIEASAARQDPRATDYARRYLARYPNGRFRALAERALGR